MTINVADKYNLDMTGATDNALKLNQLAMDMAVRFEHSLPMPRLVFPEGKVSFSVWPNLAYPNLQIVAEGDCRLLGNVALDGSIVGASKEPGIDGLCFEGFTVLGNLNITACHRSRFDVVVRDTIKVIFCILGEFRIRLEGRNQTSNGLVMDALPGNASLQSTANTFINPIIEGHDVGCWLKNAGGTTFVGGTIESCNTGIRIDSGGNNRFFGVDIEGNQTDIYTGSGAHNNTFWLSDPSRLKWSGSWNITNRVM